MNDTQNQEKRSRRREQAIWGTVSVVLLGAILVLAITPNVFAQSYNESDRALDVIDSVFRFIEENYVDGADVDALLAGALKGMFESLDDPYSVYLDERAMRGLNDSITGAFGGVGIYISKQQDDGDDARAGFVEVISPIEGTPADRAGIRAGDLIIGILDEASSEELSTEGLTIDEVVGLIRGEPGTTVTLTIRRGSRAEFPVTLTRDTIELPTVRRAMIPENIAYLRITQFSGTTEDEVREAAEFFHDNDYQSMIIDLRSNPGGTLDGVVEVADLFFESGTIVGTYHRDSTQNERFLATPGVVFEKDIPIVVMVDEGSASAAEILSGALQDRDRGYLIGENTYGKGSVQWIRSLGDTGFKLTAARYYLPSGRIIDGVGVAPDQVVETPELSDEEAEIYADLRLSERVPQWVGENLDATDQEINAFAGQLVQEGYELPDRWLRMMIHTELDEQNDVDAVYDLEFDIMLQEAIRLLQSGEVAAR